MKFSIVQICGHSFIGSLLNQNSLVLDLGGNKGEFAYDVLDRFRCTVYSIEPVPELFKGIRERAGLQKFHCGIAGKTGDIRIHLPQDRCASIYPTGKGTDRSLIVQGISINDFISRNHIALTHLLKVDIEGAELDLFETVNLDYLKNVEQITIEFHDFLYPEMRDAVERTKKKIAAAGFFVIPFSLNDGDVLFVRRGMISFFNYLYLKYFLRYVLGIKRIIKRRVFCNGL